MGQKTSPIGFRLALKKQWKSLWFANKKEFGEHLFDARHIGVNLLLREKRSGFVLEGWVAQLSGAAAQQDDRPVPGLLHPPHHHNLQQAAHMQTGGCAIKPVISRQHARRRTLIKRVDIGALMEVSAFHQGVD